MFTENKQLALLLSLHWRALLLRGLIAVGWGIPVSLSPEISRPALLVLFGTYVLTDSLVGVWMAIRGCKDYSGWWILLLWGLVGLGVGFLALLEPDVSATALVFYIAVWAIATGLFQIMIAIHLRQEIVNVWLLIVSGLTGSVCIAILIAPQTDAGATALLWLIGVFATILGVLFVALALEARNNATDDVLRHVDTHDRKVRPD